MASFDAAGQSVLQWQDDIFLTQPLDVRDIPYWYEGNLEQAIEKARGGYKSIIENTARKITDEKLYFDIHTPIIYGRKFFELLVSRYKWWKTQYLVKSCYYDIASEYINLPITPMQDCKLHGPETKRERMDKINGSMFFSTSQQAIDPEMIEIFEQLYPEKSKYEINR